jgi:hypothetical protein
MNVQTIALLLKIIDYFLFIIPSSLCIISGEDLLHDYSMNNSNSTAKRYTRQDYLFSVVALFFQSLLQYVVLELFFFHITNILLRAIYGLISKMKYLLR